VLVVIARDSRCEAVYNVSEELHGCQRRKGHWWAHRCRFSAPCRTDYGAPLWRTDVTVRWSSWRSIESGCQ
jgi:hypothetical protein